MIGIEDKLSFLRTPGVLDGQVECVETHMSWVLLTGRRAFKLKKPIALPFLDHSTLARRERACVQEVALGRRLAGSVYLGVMPLLSTPRGLALGALDGGAGTQDGEIVDWLVVMRRLPSDLMLPAMVARNEATLAHADAVGDLLTAFYRDAPRAEWDGPAYRHRLSAIVNGVSLELAQRGIPPSRLLPVVDGQLAGIVQETETLDARVEAGRVVEAHGDLRPEHVCLEQPPVVIDPLEFDADLRTLDAASELAFFALECDRLGAGWFGDRVIARYVEQARDEVPPSILALYRGQHALTRALIALRHIDDVSPEDRPAWRAKADDYLIRAGAPPSS